MSSTHSENSSRQCDCNSECPVSPQLPRLSETQTTTSSCQRRIEIPSPGTILTVNKSTTDATITYLLQQLNVRIVHIQLAYVTADELVALMLKVTTAIDNHHIRRPLAPPIARAFELHGRSVRIGRFRNDQTIELSIGGKVMLTSSAAYALCSSKDVLYLSNFNGYLPLLHPGDHVFLNTTHRIQLTVAKVTCAMATITCCVVHGGQLKSYADVTLPYLLATGREPNETDRADCLAAREYGADFVLVPNVTDCEYIACVRSAMGPMTTIPLLANIELAALCDRDELDEVMACTDGIWMDKYAKELQDIESYVVDRARQMGKSVAVACADFRFRLETDYEHYLFTAADTLLLKRLGQMHVNEMKQSLRRYVQRTATTQDAYVRQTKAQMMLCQRPTIVVDCAIVTSLLLGASLIITTCDSSGTLAIRLSRQRPRCHIIAVLPAGSHALALQLAQWKCIRPVLYDAVASGSINGGNWRHQIEEQLKFGLAHAKRACMVVVGDLVVYCYDLNRSEHNDNREKETTVQLSYQVSYLAEDVVKCVV